MKRAVLLIGIFVSIAGIPDVRGQSGAKPNITNTTGGSAHPGSMLYHDWSIGEITLVSTFDTSGVILTQGLLQNEGFIKVTSVANTTLEPNLKVYPNPASSIVNIQYTATSEGKLSYRLVDMTGKVITENITQVTPGTSEQQINISNLAMATYLLEVGFKGSNGSEEMNSYKIAKIK
jgi:hypothetical protein